MSRASKFDHINPQQAVAICTAEQATQLLSYDHHQAIVAGHSGLLLTSEWRPLDERVRPFVLTVVFHQTESSPAVPPEIQAIVNTLKFQVRGGPR